MLEESLTEFPGALVLVTHDRFLLDRVSTAVLGLNGMGGAELFADYWQWEQSAGRRPEPKSGKEASPDRRESAPPKKKLSYLEAREWEQMEKRVLDAEQELEALRAEMQSPEVVSDGPRLHACYEKMQQAEAKVAALYERWAELEAKQG